MQRTRVTLAMLAISVLPGAPAADSLARTLQTIKNRANAPVDPMPPFNGSISVLTYNVRGLPWPVAPGRPVALAAIAARLRHLRTSRGAPQVVVLQEAFTAEARAIGATAGYRFVANGVSMDSAGAVPMSAADQRFAADASWWKGERSGRWVGSGLQILSDFPIVSVRRMAFPAFACAGFDCLANKGAMLARIALPGMGTPLDVVTTHLNSRRASGVSTTRANYAFHLQADILSAFIRSAHDPRGAIIAAGDFNVGPTPERRNVLLSVLRRLGGPSAQVQDAFHELERRGVRFHGDAALSLGRARDWQFFASGRRSLVEPTELSVPFGHDAAGLMLSDHVGYVARFSIREVNWINKTSAAANQRAGSKRDAPPRRNETI